MSNQAEQLNLVVTRRSADGNVEWIPWQTAGGLAVEPGSAYALIDRADYEAPEQLLVQRQGQDLIVEVEGDRVLVLEGFFTLEQVTFYPTTDIASGGGPFTGVPLTADSTFQPGTLPGDQILWSAVAVEEESEPAPYTSEAEGSTTPLLLGGLAVGGLGIALAGGGGGGGGGATGTGNPGGAASTDQQPPQITSGSDAAPVAENSGAGKVVYTASATDVSTVTFSLKTVDDFAAFSINSTTGEVTLLEDPDFETQPSYAFTVVATDASDNTSEQSVTLTVEDQNDSGPTITSGNTATPIDENSGANQVVYITTVAGEGTAVFSLAQTGDVEAFSVDPGTGAVTLLENPDFETQTSYAFTVVAVDEAGGRNQQSVTLAINDLDDQGPAVINVALTGTEGAENDILNAGDTVTVTVFMNESVNVDITGGEPRLSLLIGGVTVSAGYVGGGGGTELQFQYTLQADQNAPDGISIPANSIDLNGAVLTDQNANPAVIEHPEIPPNPLYVVDTSPPVLESSTPADDATEVAVAADIVLSFDEDVAAGVGQITIAGDGDTRVIDVTDGSQVSFDGNQVTVNLSAELNEDTTYNVQFGQGAIVDLAGNPVAGIEDSQTLNFDTVDDDVGSGIDTSIVVFDLVEGSSSDHSDRTFDPDISYDIYLLVDSDRDSVRLPRGQRWEGATNLGSDDRVILVGDGAAVQGPIFAVNGISVSQSAVAWSTAFGLNAGLLQGRTFTRATDLAGRDRDDVRLFDTALPSVFLSGQGGLTSTMYLTSLPGGILTSQGLA